MNTTNSAIQTYIDRTGSSQENRNKYGLYMKELTLFYELLKSDSFETIALIFYYGMAKGYRAAKASRKKST